MKRGSNRSEGKTFRSFHSRNFRLFFVGQTISQIGNWITLVAQTLLVYHLTHSGVDVGFLVAFQFAPVLLIGPWAGLVADRSDKRKLLFIVQVLAMTQSFSLAALAFMHHPPLWGIYAIALYGGFTVAFDNPARRAFVVEMVKTEDVNNAVSLNSALMTGSRIVGPAIAGLLAGNFGYGWCFTVDGASYIAVLIGLWMMRPRELNRGAPAVRAPKQLRAGFAYVRSMPDLWVPLVMMAIVGTLAFNFQVTITLLAEKTFHGNVATYTALFSIISVGSFIGALYAARRKSVSVRNVINTSALFGVVLIAFGLAPNFRWALPIGVLVGLASIAFMTMNTTIVQVSADPAMRGRVLALQAMVFLGSTPIGGPIVGWICQRYGARSGIVLGGVSCLAAAAWGYVMDRNAQSRPREDDEELLPLTLGV